MGKSGNLVKRKFEREHFFTFELAMWLDPEFYSNRLPSALGSDVYCGQNGGESEGRYTIKLTALGVLRKDCD